MKPKLMLIGLGDLGHVILELLAREADLGRIVVCSRNKARSLDYCNLARLGAIAQGGRPVIDFLPLDVNDRAAVVETVRREAPALILSTATLQTWWLPELLPPAQAALIKKAGFGLWLPVHLTLTLKLMAALVEAGYAGQTLTAPFPDVVNPVLGRLGLAPTCGVGNVDEITPKVRLLAAERLGVSPDRIRVWLVAHHALEPAVFGESKGEIPPFFLRVEHEGRDVTGEVGAAELLLAPYSLPAGPATHFLTAGSVVRLVRAMLAEEETFLHAPGPGGLPGGYPVLVSRKGVRPAPIPGLSLAEAIALNEKSHRFDGIDRIEADGTVVFDPGAAGLLRELLGYDCDRLPPAEAEGRALELMARFREYAARFGVDLDRLKAHQPREME